MCSDEELDFLEEELEDEMYEEAIKRKKRGIRVTGKYKARGKTKKCLP